MYGSTVGSGRVFKDDDDDRDGRFDGTRETVSDVTRYHHQQQHEHQQRLETPLNTRPTGVTPSSRTHHIFPSPSGSY